MMLIMMIKDYTNYLGLDQPDHDNENDDNNDDQGLQKLFSSDASYMQERDSLRVRFSFEVIVFVCHFHFLLLI